MLCCEKPNEHYHYLKICGRFKVTKSIEVVGNDSDDDDDGGGVINNNISSINYSDNMSDMHNNDND